MQQGFYGKVVWRIVLLSCWLCFTSVSVTKANVIDTPTVIPRPVSMQVLPGHFTLNAQTSCWLSSDSLRSDWEIFQQDIQPATGFTLTVTNRRSNRNAIALHILPVADNQLGAEGYRLSVSPKGIDLSANSRAGIFYGLQTLLQLLPPQIESHEAVKGIAWVIPCVNIEDYPRFHWRGLMLDVSRHFLPNRK